MKVDEINHGNVAPAKANSGEKKKMVALPGHDVVELSEQSMAKQRPSADKTAPASLTSGQCSPSTDKFHPARGVENAAKRQGSRSVSDSESIRAERVEKARRKLEQGDYEHPEVMEAILDRIASVIKAS